MSAAELVVPRPVALLLVGRDRIVEEGLNTVRGQVLLQGVAFGAPYRKDVEYVCVGAGT